MVAVSCTTVVVGAHSRLQTGTRAGRAYVFKVTTGS
ncbi:MAG: hypothetical protein E6K95_07580 [Thaumarchaeota archaeon]|nr:MAG: hypothetical protein E6K95_07580 [Nitrososphaerota archaeon]